MARASRTTVTCVVCGGQCRDHVDHERSRQSTYRHAGWSTEFDDIVCSYECRKAREKQLKDEGWEVYSDKPVPDMPNFSPVWITSLFLAPPSWDLESEEKLGRLVQYEPMKGTKAKKLAA